MARFLALLFALLICAASSVSSEPLKLDGNSALRTLGPFASTFENRAERISLDEAELALSRRLFEPVERPHFDAGYSVTPHWIALPVLNGNPRNAAYLLSSNIPYVPSLSVTLLRADGKREVLLDKNADTPWRADQFIGQSVVSDQFLLAPDESATLMMRFQPYGIGILPLSLETPQTAFERASSNKLIMFAFYSFAVTSLTLLFMFVLALWHPGGLNFLALFSCGLAMMAQLDGILYQWLWPGWPEWNKIASFPMLLALCAAGATTAAFMLRTGAKVRLARASRFLALACFSPLLLTPFIEIAWLILVGFVFMAITMALLTYAVINWAQLLPGKTRIALALGIAIFSAVGLILTDVLMGRGNLAAQNLALVKIFYVLISLIIMTSYATHVAALSKSHVLSVKRELSLARNEARINAELLESERRYVHAKELVARQNNRLANASHDLRQPITSLRLTLDSIAQNSNADVDETITRAFDYLDELVSKQLSETREDPEEFEDSASITETMKVTLITGTVAEMFALEAAAKNLRLKHYGSDLMISVAPMPVMRIVSNLVSNAVKHTRNGGVLIGSKRRGDRVVIEVVDTGEGMTNSELEALSVRYQKGVASDGEGLGLAICYELAAEHDYDLTVRSKPEQGTSFSLAVPAAVGG